MEQNSRLLQEKNNLFNNEHQSSCHSMFQINRSASQDSIQSYHSNEEQQNKKHEQKIKSNKKMKNSIENNDQTNENKEEYGYNENDQLIKDDEEEKENKKVRKVKRLREHKKYKNISKIIYPDDPWKIVWDLFMIGPLIFTCLVTPVDVAFYDVQPTWLQVTNIITDIVFFIDIVITFFSAYFYQEDQLVTNKLTIAKHYITGWFFIDVLGVFPFGLVFGGSGYNKMIRIIRIQRLYKVFRINKLQRIFIMIKSLKENFKILRPQFRRLVISLFSIMMFCHIIACMWYLLAKVHPVNSWVTVNQLDHLPGFDIYIISFYWVAQTIVTVGYGDIKTANPLERVVACLLMLVGVFFYSFTIGNLTSLVANYDNTKKEYLKKVNTLMQIKAQYKIDSVTVSRIKSCLKQDENIDDIDCLLNNLPYRLKLTINHYIYHDLIQGLYFFTQNDNPRLVPTLGPLLNQLKIDKGQYVFQTLDFANEMYFIKSGQVSYVLPQYDDFVFMNINQNNHFGQTDIFLHQNRSVTALATQDCQLLTLNRKHFKQIFLNEFKTIGQNFYRESIKKKQQIQIQQFKALNYCDTIYNQINVFEQQTFSQEYINTNKSEFQDSFEILNYSYSQKSDEEHEEDNLNLIQQQNDQKLKEQKQQNIEQKNVIQNFKTHLQKIDQLLNQFDLHKMQNMEKKKNNNQRKFLKENQQKDYKKLNSIFNKINSLDNSELDAQNDQQNG